MSNIGVSANLLQNSDFQNGSWDRWSTWSTNTTSLVWGMDLALWYPIGGHAAYGHTTSRVVGQELNVYNTDKIPVSAGDKMEFYALVSAHRCDVRIRLEWSVSVGDTDYTYTPEPEWCFCRSILNAVGESNATDLRAFTRIGQIVQVPTGVKLCRINIIKGETAAGQADSWMFITRAFLGVTQPNQTQFSAWSASTPSLRGLGYTGDLGANKNPSYITDTKITGTSIESCTLTGNVIQTAATGKRIAINESGNNCLVAYSANGNTKLVEIGATAGSGVLAIDGTTDYAIYARNNASTPAIYGINEGPGVNTTGISGMALAGIGVNGSCGAGGIGVYGWGQSGATAIQACDAGYLTDNTTPFRIVPNIMSIGSPVHIGKKGSFWVNSTGQLYYNKLGTTQWTCIVA